MPNLLHPAFGFDLSQVLLKSVMLGTLSMASVLGGVVPRFVIQPFPAAFDAFAYAQAFTNEEVTNYARAVLDIEQVRKSAFSEIKRAINSGVMPSVVCNQTDALDQLSGEARRIFVEYCQQSKTIVENHGLTPSRFNEITLSLHNDSDLQKRVRSALIQLQR
jgi:hypothetical protein